jgi:hypothetical protein
MRREVGEPGFLGKKRITYYFNTEETHLIADGATIATAIGAAIPDPYFGPSLAMAGAVMKVWAKSAIRRNKCLGLHLEPGIAHPTPVPFEYRP